MVSNQDISQEMNHSQTISSEIIYLQTNWSKKIPEERIDQR